MSGLYNGHIHEFPSIRIDSFSQSPTPGFPAAQLYLLTHAHTDHLTGLDSASTNIVIICSEVTKRLVLNYEREKDRVAFDRGNVERRRRAYVGLVAASEAARTGKRKRGEVVRDPFRVIPFDVPQRFELGYDATMATVRSVVITMLDANHCPGSSMFLLSDPDTGVTVLHTGDVRPDRPFLDRLERHPAVQPYLARVMGMDVLQRDAGRGEDGVGGKGGYCGKRLERVYLDTSAVIGTCDMPSKEEAVRGLIQTLQMYPDDTIFYLYTWCTGYEDALKAIAMLFGVKIHVDRWRYSNYHNVIDDPVLQALCIMDDKATRFHSCERRNQCAALQAAYEVGSGRRVVSVEFVEEKAVEHAVKMKEVRRECALAMQGKGQWPVKLYCPLARHATLPELQALLDLFKPKSLSPNTLLPSLKGADYYAMIAAFGDCLAPGGKEDLRQSCLRWFKREKGMRTEEEVCAFARKVLLFQGDAEEGLDLRPGRNANRQRQSDAFLPSLPVASKGTLNSPRADSIPAEPSIVVSPSVVRREVFGRMDGDGESEHESSQDTQEEKLRESRSLRAASKIVNAQRPTKQQIVDSSQRTCLGDVEQKAAEEKPPFIVFPASPHSERLLKRGMAGHDPESSTRVTSSIPGLLSLTWLKNDSATWGRSATGRELQACPERRGAMPVTPLKSPSVKKSGNGRNSLRNSFNS